MENLTEAEKIRYGRQMLLPEIGSSGQARLKAATVAVVGAGGLGSPAALYLAAAGVGKLIIIDPDVVDLSNLQRQILHQTSDLNRPKVQSARESLLALNPEIEVEAVAACLTWDNAARLLAGVDYVIDAVDGAGTKFVINDVCLKLKLPFCHCGVTAWGGELLTVLPGQSPCYRCLFPEPPEQLPATPLPIIGAVAGVGGSLEAISALKFLTGAGDPGAGTLLRFNLLEMSFRKFKLAVREGCRCQMG